MKIVNVVEDDLGVLCATADYLEVRGYTVRKFAHVDAFLAQIVPNEESASLISFAASGGKGLWLLREIERRHIRTIVIMVGEGEETAQVVEAMKIGAVDVLEKPFLAEQLEQAIVDAFDTKRKPVTSSCIEGFTPPKKQLTAEEDAILVLLSQGFTVKEVAAKLDISVRTVHYRKNAIFEKIGVRNRTEAMSWVAQSKLEASFHAPT